METSPYKDVCGCWSGDRSLQRCSVYFCYRSYYKKLHEPQWLWCCCHSIQAQPLYIKLLSLSPLNLASAGEKTQKHYCPWVIFASLLTKEQNVCAAMNKTGRSLCSHSQSESPQKLFSEADWLVLALLQTPLYCPVIHTVTLKKIMVANVKLLTDADNDIPHLKAPMKSQGCTRGPVRTNCMRPNFVQTSRTLFFILVEIRWCPRISYILGINISPCGHQISEWLAVSVCIYIFII